MGGDLTVTTTPEFTLSARIPVEADIFTDGDALGMTESTDSPDEQETQP